MEGIEILQQILSFEHRKIAERLQFKELGNEKISNELLVKTIGLIDRLSRKEDDLSKKAAITLSSILWTYKEPDWEGLSEFLIITLTRMGFSPSAIMVDPSYDYNERRFTSINSLIDKLLIATEQLKYEVEVNGEIFLLTQFQKNIWEKIDKHKVLGVSAPTSAGKSFIIALKAVEKLLISPGEIIYVVPTLSLVSQVSIDFRNLLNRFGITGYEIINTYRAENRSTRNIYVLTQEKAIGAFSQSDNPFNDVKMLVVDEIQNIERVANEGDQRSKTLYDLLVEFRHSIQPDSIIISGPRIENIGSLGIKIFGETTEEEEAKSSPVANLTYAIAGKNNRYYLKQYSDLINEPQSIRITKYEHIEGQGKVIYTDEFHNYLSKLIDSLGSSSKNIIFSPTADQARKTAVAISKSRPAIDLENLDDLIKYLKHSVHPKYELCNTLLKGVAYHHGKLPHHVRRVVEKAIKDKIITNIVCTTTLMQGVNLPAQNVIIRNPNLFVRKGIGKTKLTHYEIANLRGRAGRLLQDFLGRTIVLDENAFEMEEERQEALFEDTTKEIRTGYDFVFSEYREKIVNGLYEQEVPAENNTDYSFLMTYIRQTILKHKERAIERFRNVGIEMSEEEVSNVNDQLSSLEVPLDICLRNRYWDPLDLNRMYLDRDQYLLPTNGQDAELPNKLRKLVIYLRANFPRYADRYFRVPEVPGKQVLFSACINASKWLNEIPLNRILTGAYHEEPENIDKTINTLQNDIAYGLPMLLRPAYDIKEPDSVFLRFIETGAYRPITRRLIEYNIPRETAIELVNRYFSDEEIEAEEMDNYITEKLKREYLQIDYWMKVQLEALI